MTSFVEINGKKYKNVKDAATLTGYSRDYIGRLAREKKIDATQIGRQWFVSIESLTAYSKLAEDESKSRQQKLSDERKREREIVNQIAARERSEARVAKRKNVERRALAATVLMLGVGLGLGLNASSLFDTSAKKQIATVTDSETLLATNGEFPVATGSVSEPLAVDAIDFSQESMTITSFDEEGLGVMLLPNAEVSELSEGEVKALFSDPVTIVKDDEGNRFVVRTTKDGKEERLPFAVVPVANKETP